MLTVYLIAVAIVGLGLYAALVRRGYLPMLGPGVILLGVAGIGILRLLPTDGDDTALRTLIALVMLWIGWIGLTALVVQLMNRRLPDIAPVPSLTGAVATLAPIAGFLIVKTFS